MYKIKVKCDVTLSKATKLLFIHTDQKFKVLLVSVVCESGNGQNSHLYLGNRYFEQQESIFVVFYMLVNKHTFLT